MPNTYIDNKDAWLRLSEVDYIGQFVKTWLAFNAWYRSAYAAGTDRAIIEEIKWNANPVSGHLRPLLEVQSEEAEQFRADIALLHHRLQNHEIASGKGAAKERITLTNIYLRSNPPTTKTGNFYGYAFTVDRQVNNSVRVEVVRNQNVRFTHLQQAYDLAQLEALPAYQQSLTDNLRQFLRALYLQAAPKTYANLLNGHEPPIVCGAFTFRCGRDALFSGVVEALYLMRCTLFHGELAPTQRAMKCYEPGYRLVRKFLDCVA
jgi:hypothetical protein